MKKFSDKNFNKNLKDDLTDLDIDMDKLAKSSIDNEEWEIVSIVDVSLCEPPKTNEAIVINAELGQKEVKRGNIIWITALLKKKKETDAFHSNQMGVIKTRIVDIYNTISILNTLNKNSN